MCVCVCVCVCVSACVSVGIIVGACHERVASSDDGRVFPGHQYIVIGSNIFNLSWEMYQRKKCIELGNYEGHESNMLFFSVSFQTHLCFTSSFFINHFGPSDNDGK